MLERKFWVRFIRVTMPLYLLMGKLEQENLFQLRENHQISKDCFRCALRTFFV